MQRLNPIDAIPPALRRTRDLLGERLSAPRLGLFGLLGLLTFATISLPPTIERRFQAPEVSLYTRLEALHFAPVLENIGIGLAVVAIVALLLALLLSGPRAPFMLFDLVSGQRSGFRELWYSNGDRAWRWFWFSICVAIAYSVVSYLLHRLVEAFHLQAGWTHLLLSGVSTVVAAVGLWLANDFVVAIFALEGGAILDAARDLLLIMREDLAGFSAYIALRLALAFVAAAVLMVVSYAEDRLLLVPVERVALRILQANADAAMTHFSAGLVLAALAVALVLLLELAVYVCLTAPAALFFEALALYFFAGRYAALAQMLPPPKRGALPSGLAGPDFATGVD